MKPCSMRILNFAQPLTAGGRRASGMMVNVFPLDGLVVFFFFPVLSLMPDPAILSCSWIPCAHHEEGHSK